MKVEIKWKDLMQNDYMPSYALVLDGLSKSLELHFYPSHYIGKCSCISYESNIKSLHKNYELRGAIKYWQMTQNNRSNTDSYIFPVLVGDEYMF